MEIAEYEPKRSIQNTPLGFDMLFFGSYAVISNFIITY